MRQVLLSLPTLGFAVATRAALGAGIALLVSSRLTPARRRAVGTTLVAIGAATTVPVLMAVFGQGRPRLSDSEIAKNLRDSEGDQDVPGAPDM